MQNGATLRVRAIGLALVLGAMTFAYLALTAAHPPTAGASLAAKSDKDCDDFPTQKKAQKFFKKHNPRSDPDYLDADNDRIACEDNRCPCTRKWHQQHARAVAVPVSPDTGVRERLCRRQLLRPSGAGGCARVDSRTSITRMHRSARAPSSAPPRVGSPGNGFAALTPATARPPHASPA